MANLNEQSNGNGGVSGILMNLPQDILRSIRVEKEVVYLVWGGEDPEQIEVHGQTINLPPRNEVSDHGRPGSIYRYPPAIGKDGRAIPGTLALQTVTVMNTKTRAIEKKFDAVAVMDFLTGQGSPESAQKLINRGLLALRRLEDVERVLPVVAEAYDNSVRAADEALLRNELERQKTYRDAGEQPPPSPMAKKIVAAARRHSARDRSGEAPGVDISVVEDALGIDPSARSKPAASVPVSVAAPLAVPSVPAWPSEVVSHLLEEARSVGYKVPGEVLMGLAEQDRQAVRVLAGLVEEARAKGKAEKPEKAAK